MIRLLLFLLVPMFGFSQKTFHFDYMLTYENTYIKEDSIKKQTTYLTNSKDNSYFASLTIENNLTYKLTFTQHDKVFADVQVSIAQFKKAEFITIACAAIIKKQNKFKHVANHYEFIQCKDTIINNKSFAAYKLRPTYTLKETLENHAGSNLYIVDTTFYSYLPMLIHPTAFEVWTSHKRLPHGIIYEKRFSNELNEELQVDKLVSIFKIDKNIITSGNCDHLK